MAEKPLTDSINALTTYINEITGGTDENLSDAISTLADGYGSGGYSIDDIVTKSQPSGDIIISSSSMVASVLSSCTNIESVRFTNQNLTYIPNLVFNSCTDLKTVTGEYVTEIGASVFNNCRSLTTVILPNLVKGDQNAFYGCKKLVEISLPKLIRVPFQFFRDCSTLKIVKLASCTGFQNSYQFTACGKLTDVYLPNDASTYSGAPWGAPSTCTFHYNTIFDENGEPVIE